MLTKANGIITNSSIIELFGNKKTIISDLDKLITSYYHKRQDSFTGIITINNIFGSIQESKEYSLGLIKFWKMLRGFGKSNDKTILSTDKKVLSGCVNWYWVTWDSEGNETSRDYLYTICSPSGSDYQCDQIPIIDHKGVQSIHSLCDGSGSSNEIIDVEYITNNVTNLCLSTIITNLTTSGSLNNNVTSMLRNTFGTSDQVNINFSDVASLSSGAPAETSGSSLNNLDVVFIKSQLANASQEYLAETAIHEIYHAYLFVNPTIKGNLSQHLYMAQNYVNSEVSALQQQFPSLSLHDAQCLAIAGYGELQQNDPNAFNTILSTYGFTANDVSNTNNNYKAGNTGTHC